MDHLSKGPALHSLLTVCIGCNLSRPCETYVHVGCRTKQEGAAVKVWRATWRLDYISMPPLTPQI